MKNLFILFIFSSIISCSTTQSTQKVEEISTRTEEETNEILIASIRTHGGTPKFTVYDEPPFLIKRVLPEKMEFTPTYPLKGKVLLEVEIFEDGSVGAINVVKSLMAGPGGMDECAIKAVKQWIFTPAKNNGKPVACWITFPIECEYP